MFSLDVNLWKVNLYRNNQLAEEFVVVVVVIFIIGLLTYCSLCNCEWYSEVVKSDTTFVNITEGLSKQVLF